MYNFLNSKLMDALKLINQKSEYVIDASIFYKMYVCCCFLLLAESWVDPLKPEVLLHLTDQQIAACQKLEKRLRKRRREEISCSHCHQLYTTTTEYTTHKCATDVLTSHKESTDVKPGKTVLEHLSAAVGHAHFLHTSRARTPEKDGESSVERQKQNPDRTIVESEEKISILRTGDYVPDNQPGFGEVYMCLVCERIFSDEDGLEKHECVNCDNVDNVSTPPEK